ncbi:MAG: helix-turn-helix domain-containing protein [Acidobacteriia bacterium]|nr:helix-turn-helix domain-containing protein [Terriglobia bacterium]
MMIRGLQPILAFATAHLDEDLSLAALAAQAGLSPFHLHRVFSAAAGETPKQFTLRLRLGRAAAMLLAGDESVLNVALSCGFQSHEAFCRAFRSRFGMTPSAYRERGFVGGADRTQAKTHAELVDKVGPCIGLFHTNEDRRSPGNEMAYSITKKELAPQSVLIVRRRVRRSDIAATIAEALPHIFLHAQQNGIALAGLPFTRYVEIGPGMVTMEPGMRVSSANPSGQGEIVADTLPGGPVATTTHMGPYDTLTEAYAAIEQWIAAEGLVAAGAPWEAYVTDPGDYPDPKDWKTEVFWPLAS